ncbi:MAG: polysaccharide biosynthesis protein [Syntrophomonadaceae bacterium]
MNIKMHKTLRLFMMIIIDAILVNLGVYIALHLRFDGNIPAARWETYYTLAPIITLVFLITFMVLKLYSRIWEYASIREMLAIISACTIGTAVIFLISYLPLVDHLPRSVYIISWCLIGGLIGLSRLSWRLFRYFFIKGNPEPRNVLIIGAGDAGFILAREIKHNPQLNLRVAAFVDDDITKHGRILYGARVEGDRDQIPHLAEKYAIAEIIIAMPSACGETIRSIMYLANQTRAQVRILPGIYQSTAGDLFFNLREIQMEDLLKREPVKLNYEEMSNYIAGRTVLITGAGGSIGSELCRQIMDLSPARMILVECSENNLFDIENELLDLNKGPEICPELIDVRRKAALEKVFFKHHPQVVFHAAAYKHVPMMERHPEEAFYNNVLGTRNMAVLSDQYGVETFIFISTDKAVNPTSVMGASKRLAEMIIRDVNHHSKTNFAAVRFGNVLGSRGSVIPTFIKQIEQGGPVTVTHPEMKRYFMTIPEAVQLVIQAGAMAKGGEIFVLDMGKPVKIVDLAKDLIRLAGYEPGVDIEIKYTGIRPGEKLYEELFTNKEQMVSTKHERIFISNDELEEKYNNIEKTILTFAQVGRTNNKDVVEMISKLVPEYRPRREKLG